MHNPGAVVRGYWEGFLLPFGSFIDESDWIPAVLAISGVAFYSLLGVSLHSMAGSGMFYPMSMPFYSLLGVSPRYVVGLGKGLVSSNSFLLPFGSFFLISCPLFPALLMNCQHQLSTPFWEFPKHIEWKSRAEHN